ncbi:MAG: 1-acyl-sn-glycerol-3-phosphate acyltransferase [Clostridia bacterium]|nr:1-acyl-sn-glycerol-3-phosphate acyltransferase [Clostridia bacterium]
MATEGIVKEEKEKKSILYPVARGFAAVLFSIFMPVRYHGAEKLRQLSGACVLISNHLHALDPLILAKPVKQQCIFLAKKELAVNRFIQWVLTDLHCIFVDRHNTDMEAMRACMRVIRNGQPLVIFPEGTRHHEGQMEQIENGTSLIVLRGKAPLIPIYLDRPLKFFRRVNAYVGEPIEFEDLTKQGVNVETCEKLNQRMRETYRQMAAKFGKA